MSKSLKKIVEECRDKNLPEVEMCDRGISNMLDIPGLFTLSNITQLVLSHNKLTVFPEPIHRSWYDIINGTAEEKARQR